MASLKLKEILIAFLKGEELHYPIIEASIIQSNPFQISDDNLYYFDSCNLQELAEVAVNNSRKRQKIVLNIWNFVFRRVPGTHDYYFDINCKDYQLVDDDSIVEEDCTYIKVISDEMVRYSNNPSDSL